MTSHTVTNDVIYTCDDVANRFCLPTLKLEDRGTKTKNSRKSTINLVPKSSLRPY